MCVANKFVVSVSKSLGGRERCNVSKDGEDECKLDEFHCLLSGWAVDRMFCFVKK